MPQGPDTLCIQHGDLTQAKRDTVIRQFREKTIDILVATDVAARGLDISGVTHGDPR